MKKYLLLICSIIISGTIFAQSFAGMKIMKAGITASFDQDMIRDINAEYFIATSKDGVNSDIENVNFQSHDITSMICENPALRAEVTMQPFRGVKNVQLNTGASLMFNRNDATYYNYGYQSQSTYENINFSSFSNEFAIDATLLYHQKLWFLNLYGGVGTNLGMSFMGTMNIEGSYNETQSSSGSAQDDATRETELVHFYEDHQMKNMLHQRVFGQFAATAIICKKFELGLETRLGLGYRKVGSKTVNTELHSTGIVTKWIF